MALDVSCPVCEDSPGNDDCEACGGRGYFQLSSCPAKFIDRELQDCYPIADLFREGTAPAPGGSMDQTKWLLNFCSRAWGDENRITAARQER
ncbi:MAG: hypothetical protein AB7O68_25945 [Pirellulales bacterium]